MSAEDPVIVVMELDARLLRELQQVLDGEVSRARKRPTALDLYEHHRDVRELEPEELKRLIAELIEIGVDHFKRLTAEHLYRANDEDEACGGCKD